MLKLCMAGVASVSLLWGAQSALAQDPPAKAELRQQSAVKTKGAERAMMLASAVVNHRIVAVGDHGIVLISDDGGKTFRQANQVPTRAMLTGVAFVDPNNGWAVGHWGVILRTADGGETWTLQRDRLDEDRPLFSVWFKDQQTGIATGLWGLVLRTTDGGKTWTEVELPAAEGRKAEKNLYRVFAGPKNDLFIAAERGAIYRSTDAGASFAEIATGHTGSFWTGITASSGTILVAGLRGSIYRSADGGANWEASESGVKSSITDLTQIEDGTLVAVGLDGVVLRSKDDGKTFKMDVHRTSASNTSVARKPGGMLIFTANGVERSGKT